MSERLGWGRDRDIAVQDWSAERSAQIRGGASFGAENAAFSGSVE